jgi:hypothetical protein
MAVGRTSRGPGFTLSRLDRFPLLNLTGAFFLTAYLLDENYPGAKKNESLLILFHVLREKKANIYHIHGILKGIFKFET